MKISLGCQIKIMWQNYRVSSELPVNKRRAVMSYWAIAGLVLLCAVNAGAELHTESVEYRDGETILEGYLAYDTAVIGKRPGVLVVHEWWGNNAYSKRRAEQLAK